MLIYKKYGVDATKTHWRIDENGEAVRYEREGKDWNVINLFLSGNPFKIDKEFSLIDETATVPAPAPKKKVAPKK